MAEKQERRRAWRQDVAEQQLDRQATRTALIQRKIDLMNVKRTASVELIRSSKWDALNAEIAQINAKLTSL